MATSPKYYSNRGSPLLSRPPLSLPPPPPPPPPLYPGGLSPSPSASPGHAPPSSFASSASLVQHHSHQFQQQQRRAEFGRPYITTTLSPVQNGESRGSFPSPHSPYDQSSGLSPLSQSGSQGSPQMALRPGMVVEYNPQQWGRGGPTGGVHVPHSAFPPPTLNAEDGLPSPPPPYSPAPLNQVIHSTQTPPPSSTPSAPPLPYLQTSMPTPPSSVGDYASPLSAITIISPLTAIIDQRRASGPSLASQLNQTASPIVPPSFPPPPGQDRANSRTRIEGTRSRFGLSALTRGRSGDRSASYNAIDSISRPVAAEFPARPPVPRVETPPQYSAQPRNLAGARTRASVYAPPSEPVMMPPSSRRSASADSAGPSWGASMPLPPPPPGPPPSGSRSASVTDGNRRHDTIEVGNITVPILSMPTRRPPNRGTVLGPVPRTPADWLEDSSSSRPSTRHSESTDSEDVPRRLGLILPSTDTAGAPTRDSTVKGIRERRSESRAARDRMIREQHSPEIITAVEAKPADLVLSSPSGGISRQGAVKKSRPSMSPQESRSGITASALTRRTTGSDSSAVLPTFSPASEQQQQQQQQKPNSSTQSKDPVVSTQTPSKLTNDPTRSHGQPPLLQRRGSAIGKMQSLGLPGPSKMQDEEESFAQASLERHQQFAQKERMASSDRERLELFAEYLVAESRLRRDRFSAAFSAMGSDILDLTRDLWRPYQASPTALATSSAGTQPRSASQPRQLPRKESFDSHTTPNTPGSSQANFTPRTESESPSSVVSQSAGRDGTVWQYKPVLSPIPSMAMSIAPDEERSRGRSASRWWESDTGSNGAAQRIERSKRESKYMGIHREGRFNLQWQDEHSPSLVSTGTPARMESSSEYPPEKVGWHEESSYAQDCPTPHYSVPNTPSAVSGLDISRLVTLPPPYPRHYPAEANSHPDLASMRSTLRNLTDLDDVRDTKRSFEARRTRQRAVQAQEEASRVAQMRHNISEQIRLGQMTYAAAAAAEDSFHATEAKSKQQIVRAEFESFQPEVMSRLNAFLSERITRATASISQLQAGLSSSASESNPEGPMEEGDERPELLEKLKLLKWLVEARETVYRETFELESDRCDLYKEVVINDLRSKGETEDKIREAEKFFNTDRLDRKGKFEKEARSRIEDFATIIDSQVSRGVEDQLSAFWDIAPGLLEVVKKIPVDERGLSDLRVAIPFKEVEENPAYNDFPLQYLYGLLRHTQKSAYQFIENQVGLLCLLHEVGLNVMRAGLRVVEVDRAAAEALDGESDEDDLRREMSELGRVEEERLTGELKDRVGVVEGQWRDALGGELDDCVERVESTLQEVGGWDESLRE